MRRERTSPSGLLGGLVLWALASGMPGQAVALEECREADPLAEGVFAETDGATLRLWSGNAWTDLLPVLLVAFSPPERHSRTFEPQAAARRVPFAGLEIQNLAGTWSVEARAEHEGVRYALKLQCQSLSGLVLGRIEVAYGQSKRVQQEVLRFEIGPGFEVRALDRAYRFLPVTHPTFADPLTPHLVELVGPLGPIWLEGRRGVQGVWVLPRAADRYFIDLEIDHQENHPFRTLPACLKKTGRSQPVLRFDETPRGAGERFQAEFRFQIGAVRPVLPGRYPAGQEAALVFTDHADQSDAARLEAFAFGRTGALDDAEIGPGHPGFVNRGLSYTKTVFVARRGRYSHQLDDPAFRRVLGAMAARGVEVGVHSPTGKSDHPAEVLAMLQEFRAAYAGRTWIDHQPDTNCEAIANQGAQPASDWYCLDALARAGFVYIGNLDDVRFRPGTLNMFFPDWPAARPALIYQSVRLRAGAGAGFFQFGSSWMLVRRDRFLSWFDEALLDRLAEEHGLLISHVYFEMLSRRRDLAGTELIEQTGEGCYALRPEADLLFLRLEARAARGGLWVTGIEALAGHILGAMGVEIDLLQGGVATIRSRSNRELHGLSLVLPPGCAKVRIDGMPPTGWRRSRGSGALVVWFDLGPQQTRRLEALDESGAPLALFDPHPIELRLSTGPRELEPEAEIVEPGGELAPMLPGEYVPHEEDPLEQ